MSSFLNSVFGSTPQVAKFKPLDYSDEQKSSIAGNIGNFDQIAQLGDLYKKYYIDQQNSILPGYSDTMAAGEKGAKGILDVGNQLLTGELPQDVKDQIQRNSAYQSLAGGYAGSGMSKALTARDLGLTSLDLMKQGASMIGQGGNSAQQWASMAKGDMLDPGSLFTTPGQTSAFDLQNSILKQQSQQYAFNVAAAPDPVASGISNTIMSLIGAYLGGGMGKGGGQAGVAQYDQSNSFNAGGFGGRG